MIDERVQAYAEAHTSAENEVMRKLNRETHAKVNMPQMLSGHMQGQFLRLMSILVKPQHVLEVGTYTGYSAIALAAGLRPGGLLHTIDNNEELEEMALSHWEEAGMHERIRQYVGDAREVIPTLDFSWDLVFIDADKENYGTYYDLVIDQVRTDGLIIADNVLWSGKVVEQSTDKKTRALQEFNDRVHADERVENLLLPIRDGLMILRKIQAETDV